MSPTRLSPIAVDLIAALPGVSMGIGTVWYVSLMRGVWTAAALSPICGHGGAALVHCAPCYAALMLVFGGVAMALMVRPRRPSRLRAPS